MSDPTPKTVLAVLERDDRCCVRCGDPIQGSRGYGWSIHHRQPRGMGGTKAAYIDEPQNLLTVCGHGTVGCHGEIERHRSDAEDAGWIVRRPTDPATVPVDIKHWRKGERVYYLTDSGYSDTYPEPETEVEPEAAPQPKQKAKVKRTSTATLDLVRKLPNQAFQGRPMQAKYQCLHCKNAKWRLGGSALLSQHLLSDHGIDDMFPRTQLVNEGNYVVSIDGAVETVSGVPVKATRDRRRYDGWLRSVWSVTKVGQR